MQFNVLAKLFIWVSCTNSSFNCFKFHLVWQNSTGKHSLRRDRNIVYSVHCSSYVDTDMHL